MIRFFSVGGGNIYDLIVMHEDVYRYFMEEMESIVPAPIGCIGVQLPNLNIHTDQYTPKHPIEWKFPEDKFTIYEESDKVWAIPLKYGSFQERKDLLAVWMIANKSNLYNSPILLNDEYLIPKNKVITSKSYQKNIFNKWNPILYSC